MNILVCVKQVRESAQKDALWILNPSDGCAVEAALKLRTRYGGKVTVLTMGRAQAEDMLRELYARGVDRCLLVSDIAYAGSDTLATARVLAAAAVREGPFDCILTGRRAVDGETAQTPARLAQLLGWNLLTDVAQLDSYEECVCEREDERLTLRFRLPAVLTLREHSHPLRLMSILGMRRAKNAVIEKITNRELQLDAAQCGLAGSPTSVKRMYEAPEQSRHVEWLKNGGEIVRLIREKMAQAEQKSHDEGEQSGKVAGSIWVLCEQEDADARALLRKAKQLSDEPVTLLVAGRGSVEAAAAVIREGAPAAVLCPASGRMRTLAPQVATVLETGLTADCTGLDASEDGLLLQTRPTYGGAQMAQILCRTARPQMAMIRSGVLEGDEAETADRVLTLPDETDAEGLECLKREKDTGKTMLREAELVVAGGLGIGGKAEFDQLRTLTAHLGGEIAATRAAVDAGWAEYSAQVGQTGLTVRPKVYLAMGISGAIQHVLGMQHAGTVIAVNQDPKAPIFGHADYGIAGDWKQVMKEIEEALS